MRMLLPEARDAVDVAACYLSDERPPPPGRPWVMANMVASLDGAASVEGRSGGLGGAPDRQVFHVIRTLPDVIVAGAGTVRTERYGPPRLDAVDQAARVERGQRPLPRLAIVSARLDLGADLPVAAASRAGDAERPLVLCPPDGPDRDLRRRDAAGPVAEWADLVPCGDEPGRVDLAAAMGALAGEGHRLVLSEGGPSLCADLHALDLLDELLLTVAPVLVGGSAPRILAGGHHELVRDHELRRVLEADGVLFLRTTRRGERHRRDTGQ